MGVVSGKIARPATHATSRAEVHGHAGRLTAGHRVSRHWRGQEETHRSAFGDPHANRSANHGSDKHAKPEGRWAEGHAGSANSASCRLRNVT